MQLLVNDLIRVFGFWLFELSLLSWLLQVCCGCVGEGGAVLVVDLVLDCVALLLLLWLSLSSFYLLVVYLRGGKPCVLGGWGGQRLLWLCDLPQSLLKCPLIGYHDWWLISFDKTLVFSVRSSWENTEDKVKSQSSVSDLTKITSVMLYL